MAPGTLSAYSHDADVEIQRFVPSRRGSVTYFFVFFRASSHERRSRRKKCQQYNNKTISRLTHAQAMMRAHGQLFVYDHAIHASRYTITLLFCIFGPRVIIDSRRSRGLRSACANIPARRLRHDCDAPPQ